jgi:hypothetical protein
VLPYLGLGGDGIRAELGDRVLPVPALFPAGEDQRGKRPDLIHHAVRCGRRQDRDRVAAVETVVHAERDRAADLGVVTGGEGALPQAQLDVGAGWACSCPS